MKITWANPKTITITGTAKFRVRYEDGTSGNTYSNTIATARSHVEKWSGAEHYGGKTIVVEVRPAVGEAWVKFERYEVA